MQPIHLAIGLVEGLITAAVLIFIYYARPEILTNDEMKRKCIFLKESGTYHGCCGGCVCSRYFTGSINPDGLEWSMEQVAGSTELEDSGDGAYEVAAGIQR